MAKKQIVKRGKGGGKPGLDAAMASLAALSVGFVTFAMPNDIFSGLVTSSGLPSILSAAQPPLGQTARLAAVSVAALLTFAAVFRLLRALGRVPAKGKPRSKAAEVSAEPPRLRRADAHPDAPSRRPIFAGADLGDPLPPPAEADFADYEPTASEDAEWERPVPEFLTAEAAPAEEEAAELAEPEQPAEEEVLELAEPEEQVEEEVLEIEEPVQAEEPSGWVDDYVPPVESEPAGYVDDYSPPEVAAEEIAEPAPDFAAEPEEEPAPEVEEQPVEDFMEEPVVEASDEDPLDFRELTRRLPEDPEAQDVPIPSLIQRLEVGLIRREHAENEGEVPSESQEALDQRLRGAISDLRRMAGNS